MQAGPVIEKYRVISGNLFFFDFPGFLLARE